MEVILERATDKPVDLVAVSAGICYNREAVSDPEKRKSRLKACYANGHMSVFEHVSANWHVKGISRACSHQLVRHRLASYSQQSQRYCKIDVSTNDWYVVPPDLDEMSSFIFKQAMASDASAYLSLLNAGIKPEDARYVLPNACTTDISVTMNLREFYHFTDLRCKSNAQWEIRELAIKMMETLSAHDEEWQYLLSLPILCACKNEGVQ